MIVGDVVFGAVEEIVGFWWEVMGLGVRIGRSLGKRGLVVNAFMPDGLHSSGSNAVYGLVGGGHCGVAF